MTPLLAPDASAPPAEELEGMGDVSQPLYGFVGDVIPPATAARSTNNGSMSSQSHPSPAIAAPNQIIPLAHGEKPPPYALASNPNNNCTMIAQANTLKIDHSKIKDGFHGRVGYEIRPDGKTFIALHGLEDARMLNGFTLTVLTLGIVNTTFSISLSAGSDSEASKVLELKRPLGASDYIEVWFSPFGNFSSSKTLRDNIKSLNVPLRHNYVRPPPSLRRSRELFFADDTLP